MSLRQLGAAAVLTASSLVSPTPATAAAFTFTANTPSGLEVLSSTGGVGFGFSIGNSGPQALTLGSFDLQTGVVSDGDAVLVAFLDIGDAPLTQLRMVQNPTAPVVVTPSAPRTSQIGFLPAGTVFPANSNPFFGLSLEPQNFQAPLGAEGTAYIGFALMTSATQPLSQALGVTAPVHFTVGTGALFVGPFNFTNATVGGATFFTPVPLPAALGLLGSALGVLGWVRRKAV